MRKLVLEIDDGYANAIGMTFIGSAGYATINIYTTTVNLTDKELVGFRLVDDCGNVRMIGKYKEWDRS